jgi:hypothetical protein
MTTINQLIALLETAKQNFGGEMIVASFNRAGDKISPDGFEECLITRGRKGWHELHLTGS